MGPIGAMKAPRSNDISLQSQPTHSCVAAYDYARIRRLVRLGGSFYRFRVTENQ
jgi:hypothetical protein